MPPARRLTVAEARRLPRGELLERLGEENARWEAQPPRSEADQAAYAVYAECLHLIDLGEVLRSAMDVLQGRRNDYFKRSHCDDETKEAGSGI